MYKLSAVLLWVCSVYSAKYQPNWASLDTRPLPPWYDEAKIGIFLHWGVFSVPSVHSEWFWKDWKDNSSYEINKYMDANFPPGFTYQEFAKDFTAEFFNATEWADIFAKAGARYVVLTSKHHEGFTMWPSEYSFNWNAKDIGPHRDVVARTQNQILRSEYGLWFLSLMDGLFCYGVTTLLPEMTSTWQHMAHIFDFGPIWHLGELGTEVRKLGLKFGLYHSLFEWFNPVYLADKSNKFATQYFVKNKIIPEMQELVLKYKPSVIWSDGDWEANDTYWQSTDFLAWLYNESPVKDEIVVNDRWGIGIPCHHGDFINCKDRYNPGHLQKKKWENAMTVDKESWGFRRNARLSDYLTPLELLTVLARTISCGGNLLINIGPSKEGVINPIFEERLTQLGDWLKINGEAIYGSHTWTAQNDSINPNIWYTKRDNFVYAINLEWPQNNNKVVLGSAVSLFRSADTAVNLLGNPGKLKWILSTDRVEIELPDRATVKSETAWVLKIKTQS